MFNNSTTFEKNGSRFCASSFTLIQKIVKKNPLLLDLWLWSVSTPLPPLPLHLHWVFCFTKKKLIPFLKGLPFRFEFSSVVLFFLFPPLFFCLSLSCFLQGINDRVSVGVIRVRTTHGRTTENLFGDHTSLLFIFIFFIFVLPISLSYPF